MKKSGHGPLRRSLTALAAAALAGSLTTAPAPASAATTWLQVSAGAQHTCGVTSTHDLWCWGNNIFGQLGTGTGGYAQPVPARVGARGKWASVSAGVAHTCALDRDGRRYCWGDNHHGQLGYGDQTSRDEPSSHDAARWVTVSAGRDHTCGITTHGEAFCWGLGTHGQLGHTTSWELTAGYIWTSPQRVLFDGTWSALSTSRIATCGLDGEGARYCWGGEFAGHLGLGGEGVSSKDYEPVTTPATPPDDGIWRSVAVAPYSGCGVSKGRRLYCWGHNHDGELGFSEKGIHHLPKRVGDRKDWTWVATAQSHTCGLRTDGVASCWGSNSSGQLGRLYLGTTPTPQTVYLHIGDLLAGKQPPTWSDITTGTLHTCGVRANGTLYCWGSNTHGQLGDGTTTNRTWPAKVV